MVKLNKNLIFFLLMYGVFLLIPLVLKESFISTYAPFNYGIQQILLLFIFSFFGSKKSLFILSPAFILISYINLNFFFGSIAFNNSLAFERFLLPERQWRNQQLVMLYYNFANYACLITYFIAKSTKFTPTKIKSKFIDLRRVKKSHLLIFCLVLIVILNFFDGFFFVVSKSICAIVMFILLIENYGYIRFFYYLIIILLFSIESVDSKREAIFLILPILFLEFVKFGVKFNFLKIMIGSVGVFCIFYLIILMSITRGYGSYKVSNMYEAMGYASDFVTSDVFIPSFLNNTEISYTYLHSNQAVEYIIEEPRLMTYGETLIKPFFIFIPRSIVDFKPQSSIHYYTSRFNPRFRAQGGSYPISLPAEFFWNFHFAGLFFFFILFIFIHLGYFKIINLIKEGEVINYPHYLYGFLLYMSLIRGSGFDLFVIYFISGFIFIYIFKFVADLLLGKYEREPI